MEILILRYQETVAFARDVPDDVVCRAAGTYLSDVKRPRKDVSQQIDECLRQGLVEEESHGVKQRAR